MTFIPKSGKPIYTEAKAYRQICLSFFLLKTLERLVDRHIRDDVWEEIHYTLTNMPINQANQLIQH